MELLDARTLAISLMTEHGLTGEGWSFRFDNAKQRLGQCNHTTKTITISRYMAGAATEEQVEQTILHEIAHALVGARDQWGKKIGHGPVWKAKAHEIGYRGARTSVNPYQEQLRQQAGLPTHEQTTLAVPVFRIGQRVKLSNGTTGTIVALGRSRHQVAGDDGLAWRAPVAGLTLLADQTPPAGARVVNLAEIKNAKRIRITGGGHYLGQVAEVISVGTSRFKVRMPNGAGMFVPFALAEPLAS